MPLIYATEEDLLGYTGAVLPDADTVTRYLRAASGLVTYAIRRDRYDTTPSGSPADPELADALRDATCQQVTVWVAAGIDPATASVTQPARTVKSKSRGGASVTYSDDDQAVTARRAAAGSVLDESAVIVLRNAGFLTGQPGFAGW